MGETMDVNIRVGAKSKPKRVKKCKLQNAKPGQKSDDAITTIIIPSIHEDKSRGHDGDTGIMTADKSFDGQFDDSQNIIVSNVTLAKDKGSPAKQFRSAFANTNIQPDLVNFLVTTGHPGAFHNPLAPKIDTVLRGKYIFLSQEKSEAKTEYQFQQDGSIIIINKLSATYMDMRKAVRYSDYQADLTDKDIPAAKKTPKPQASLINASIVHKVEMKNGKPQVSIISREFNIESENVQEANAIGRLLAKKMELDFKPAAKKMQRGVPTDIEAIGGSEKRSGITAMVFNLIKQFVPNIFLRRHSNEKSTTPKEPKPATSTTFFVSKEDWKLSDAKEKPARRPKVEVKISEAKQVGFLTSHPNDSTLSSDIKKATETIIPNVLT